MSVTSVFIIWCDVSFENQNAYLSMKDEFIETTTATVRKPMDPIDMAIFSDGKEELRSNNVPLITVPTIDDALREIEKHKNDNIFIICSGSLGRILVPEIVSQFSLVHHFYIYTHNIVLQLEWADEYPVKMVKMFNFPTDLLLRLTRDIAAHFIEQGKSFLSIDAPDYALPLFDQARKLEITANERQKRQSNPNGEQSNQPLSDFRDHLDQLEGNKGLICQAEEALRKQECSLESTEIEPSV